MAYQQIDLLKAVLADQIDGSLIQKILADFLSRNVYVCGRTRDGYSVEDIIWRRGVDFFIHEFRQHETSINEKREKSFPGNLLDAIRKKDAQEFIKIYTDIESSGNAAYPNMDREYLLGAAVSFGIIEIVRFLVEQKSTNPSCICRDGESPIYIAVNGGHLSILQYLESRGVGLHVSGKNHRTLLHAGIFHINILTYLLARGLDINSQDYDDKTLLIKAADFGRPATAEFLVQFHPHLDLKDRDGDTAFAKTREEYHSPFMQKHMLDQIKKGREDVKSVITKYRNELERKKAVLQKLETLSNTTANLANLRMTNIDLTDVVNAIARYSHVHILDLSNNDLTDHDMEAFAKDLFVRTSVIKINLTNNRLSSGVEQRVINSIHPTARLKALLEQYQSFEFGEENLPKIIFLINNGADYSSLEVEGWKLIHFAAFYGNIKLIHFLSEQKDNLASITNDESKKNALHLASEKGHTEVLEYLINVTNNLLVADGENHTPLYYSVKNGKSAVASLLLKAGDNPNHNCNGLSLVKISILQRQTDIVILLLENGAIWESDTIDQSISELDRSNPADEAVIQIIEKYKDNQKALFEAAANGRINTLTELLDKSVNIQTPNAEEESVLYVALKNRHFSCVALLLNHGAEFTATEESARHLSALQAKDKIHIRDSLLEYFKRPSDAVVSYFISRTRLAGNNKFRLGIQIDLKQLYEQLYNNLLNIDFVRPVMDALEYSPQALDIIFDSSVDNVSRINPTQSLGSRGACNYKMAKIYIGAKRNFKELSATLGHELTHLACQQVFNNDCKPYPKNSLAEQQFIEIWKDIKLRRETGFKFDTVIERAFTEYAKDDDQLAELIVRVPHMIAEYGEEGLRKLNDQAPKLLSYYKEFVIPKLNEYVRKQNYEFIRSGATHINILDTLGDIDDSQSLGFSNPVSPVNTDESSIKAMHDLSIFNNKPAVLDNPRAPGSGSSLSKSIV